MKMHKSGENLTMHTKSSPADQQCSVGLACCYFARSGDGYVRVVRRFVGIDAHVDDFNDTRIAFEVSLEKLLIFKTSILLGCE